MGNSEDHGPARSGLLPDGAVDGDLGDADPEWAQYVAWADREGAAGREPEPESWAADEWEPWDPERDDPDFAGSVPAGSVLSGPGRSLFAQDGAADVMAPSPFLAALTEQAVADVAALSDSELVGVLRASRRLVAREQYKQVLATAEFGRRRQAAFTGALARGVPAGCAAGGFPGEELAIELVVTRGEAGHLIDDAIDLTGRLPRTLAQMAAGLIDADRAGSIAYYTRSLNPAGAARADELLTREAPELRAEQLARKAAALEMKLNPEAVQARRERARRDGQRRPRPRGALARRTHQPGQPRPGVSAITTQVGNPMVKHPRLKACAERGCWSCKGGPGYEVGTATAPWSTDQQSCLLKPLQLSASTGVRQAGKGCVITGCVAVMVGQPVTDDRRRHVRVGPDICQHTPSVQLLIVSPSPGSGHSVPAQRPYVLVPDEKGLGTGQAVRGSIQGLFNLRNLPLQDSRQPACRGKRLMEQGVDDKRDAHVALTEFRPHGRHQVHHRDDGRTAHESRAHSRAGLLDDQGRPVPEHDHVPVHAVHAQPLLFNEVQGTAEIRQRRIPGVPLSQHVRGGDSSGEAARTDDLQGRVLVYPGDFHGIVLHPVPVHDPVEHRFPDRSRREPPD
jgi:uncharacterized protein DUF222